jgi:hypothetical protein
VFELKAEGCSRKQFQSISSLADFLVEDVSSILHSGTRLWGQMDLTTESGMVSLIATVDIFPDFCQVSFAFGQAMELFKYLARCYTFTFLDLISN